MSNIRKAIFFPTEISQNHMNRTQARFAFLFQYLIQVEISEQEFRMLSAPQGLSDA